MRDGASVRATWTAVVPASLDRITAHARSHVDGPLLLLSLWRLAMLVLSVIVVVVMVLLLVGAMNSRDCGARANRRAKRVHRVHRTARRTAPRHHRIQHHAVDVS